MSEIQQLEKKVSFYQNRLEKLENLTTDILRNHLVGEYMSLKIYLKGKVNFYQSELNKTYKSQSTNINANGYHTV